MRAAWSVAWMVGVAMAWPSTIADSGDTGPPAEGGDAWDRLVAQGLLAPELLEAASTREVPLSVPHGAPYAVTWNPAEDAFSVLPLDSAPEALPAIPVRDAGCTGFGSTIGGVTLPPAVVGACGFQLHFVGIWTTVLVCPGVGSCFATGTNFLFTMDGPDSFGHTGFFFIACDQPGASAHLWQMLLGLQPEAGTCQLSEFGLAPSAWSLWYAACGAQGSGAWSCQHVLK